MPDAVLVEWICDKDANLASELDERGRRRWAAVEAQSLGRDQSHNEGRSDEPSALDVQEYANSRSGTSQTGLSGGCFHRALFVGEFGLQSSGESQETRGQATSRS